MPFKEVPSKVDFPAQEQELLDFWKENQNIIKNKGSSCLNCQAMLDKLF